MEASTMRERMTAYIEALQAQIVAALEAADPPAPRFRRRAWDRPQGGRGLSCTFSAPDRPDTVLEKAGVNISMIHGMLPPASIQQMATAHASLADRADSSGSLPFFAGGISLVVHPRNPGAPTVHANYRYFEITAAPSSSPTPDSDGSNGDVLAWWFGGITDLTPSYLFADDAAHFHRTLKAACDAHGGALYGAFKRSCDAYLYLPHRGEHRGVGGLRFDDLCGDAHALLDAPDAPAAPRPRTPAAIFAFVRACGDAFLPSYLPVLQRRCAAPADARRRRWQLLRRGRYVEFNLVCDRGTKFGLVTPGVQVENVLMSLPETARWEYMSEMGAEAGSGEGRMLEVLRQPRDWV